MTKHIVYIFFLFILLNCKKEKPSLQEYFVNATEKKNFLSLDVSSNILNLDKNKLTKDEKIALESFEQINILAFKKDEMNAKEYLKEMNSVKKIFTDTTFQQLIKINNGDSNGSVMLVGDENNIDELVLFGNQKDMGFTVVRVVGDDMKTENAAEFFSILQKSNIKTENLKPIFDFVNKK